MRFGVIAWLVQPLYIAVELAVIAKVTARYSIMDNTISDLGATTCTAIDYPFGPVPVCSPWHGLLNASFVVFGVLLTLGALLLHRSQPKGKLAVTATTMWVIAGLSSIGTGLVPIDADLELHALVSLPVFVAQPAALALLGVLLRDRLAVGAGVLSLVASAIFLARTGSADFGGLLERLGLWPAYLLLPFLALRLRRLSFG